MNSPQSFAANVSSKLGELARVVEDLRSLGEIYDARGGAAVFDDDALTDTGYDASSLLGVIYLNNDLQAFFNNGTPAQANRWPTVQSHRSDL